MLILVAVTISMAINGGLFEKAGKAVGDTQNAINAEQQLANGAIQIGGKWYASIDDYLAGKEMKEWITIYEGEATTTDGEVLLSTTSLFKNGYNYRITVESDEYTGTVETIAILGYEENGVQEYVLFIVKDGKATGVTSLEDAEEKIANADDSTTVVLGANFADTGSVVYFDGATCEYKVTKIEELSLVKINLSIAGTKSTTVPIPTGFKYKEGTIETGYVIENETDGNEFVWVPVDKDQKITLNITSEKDITELKLYDPYGDEILSVADGEIETTYNNTNINPTINGMYIAVVTTENITVQETLTVKSLYAMDSMNDWYTTDEYAKKIGYETKEDWLLSGYQGRFNSIEEVLAELEAPTVDVAITKGLSLFFKLYEDLADYTESVNKNGGFYIGRYEAGTEKVRTSGNKDDAVEVIKTANGTPVSKEGYYPYNHITFDQARGLAESMYSSTNFEVGLLTGSAWDRTLGWIYESECKSISEIIEDSTGWGNYEESDFEIKKGKYSTDRGESYTVVEGTYKKEEGKSVLLTTGATTRNSVNNIFDLAGNVEEWSNELCPVFYSDGIGIRGGAYMNLSVSGFFGGFLEASMRREFSPDYNRDYTGFRAAIYMK